MSTQPTDPSDDPTFLSEEQKKAGVVLRDHVYDGIYEYDQKLPNWWLFTLYIFIVWFVVYWFAYYQLGMFKTDEEQMEMAMHSIQVKKDQQINAVLADLDDDAMWEMSKDPAVTTAGAAHYNQFCVVCHAPDLSATLNGTPLPGVPLNDSEWKYCRNPTDIFNIITNGSPDVTKGMIAWEATLGPKKIAETTAFLLSHHDQSQPWNPAPDSPDATTAPAPSTPETSAPPAPAPPPHPVSAPLKSPRKDPNLISLGSIGADGSKLTLHPSDVRGFFTRSRRAFGFALLAVYIALPWIPINGFPAVFFDLEERRLHLFGLTFVPSDFWLGFFLVSGLGFSLFFLTSLLGRLWCGWACPYTVFLEHIYRRIERFIDGDAPARRRLDSAPWTGSKITKRLIKHALYLLVSAAIAHVFLSYFVSIPQLWSMMQGSPLDHAKSFGVILFFTGALYFSFAWFREQFCVILCPYGRIQSALTDDNTVIIGYDETRGEPRGKASDPDAGDCIACSKCVQVCPTGIDIRNGLQLECIGCAACIDACNSVMTKLSRPKGLIRYDSMRGLAGKTTRWLRPRIFLYTALALLGAAAFAFSLSTVHDVSISLLRMRGMPYYVTDDAVRNQFQVRLTTKRNVDTTFSLNIKDAPDDTVVVGLDAPITIEPQQEELHPFTVTIPRENYTGPVAMTLVSTSEPGGTVLETDLKFQGPDPRLFADKPPPTPPPTTDSPPLEK